MTTIFPASIPDDLLVVVDKCAAAQEFLDQLEVTARSRICGVIAQVTVATFDFMRQAHLAWFAAVEQNKRSYDSEIAAQFGRQYERWRDRARSVLQTCQECQRAGAEVEYQSDLANRLEMLNGQNLDVVALLADVRDLDAGGGMTLDEFIHGLQIANSQGGV